MVEKRGKPGESPGRILVVDDYPMNRMQLARLLGAQGHSVTTAENGRQALDLIQEQPFDVVLLDIMMPEMDGYQLLERIKADPRLRELPVIVISAVDEMDSVVRCIEMGAEDYLPKPFNPTLLEARLGTSLQRKRLRDLERSYLQQEIMLRESEKLATLGRLSAGMAHELNNPASAGLRAAGQLLAAVVRLQRSQRRLAEAGLSPAQMDSLSVLDGEAQTRSAEPPHLDSLALGDRESKIEGWLQQRGVVGGWELAPGLATLGYDGAALDDLVAEFSRDQIPALLTWLGDSSSAYSLVREVRQSTARVAELVGAMKLYTYMDQGPVQSVDVHEGLDNTLAVLGSRLGNGVAVRREYAEDLPRIEAYGSLLNQVWTNIIVNAIDAIDGHGQLVLRTALDDGWVVVEIEDDGPGIPEEIQSRVFDPFFTTKPPGSGPGLGLNVSHNVVVQKHGGRISVASRPGSTRFQVKLPVRSPRSG